MLSALLIKSLLGMTFSATFLTVFFFTYVDYTEKQVLSHQIKYVTDSLKQTIKMYSPNVLKNLQNNVKNTTLPDFSTADHKVEQANNKLIAKVLKIVSIAFFIIMFGVVGLCRCTGLHYWNHIMLDSLWILFSIAFTEFTFLYFFGRHILYVNTNLVKKAVIDKIIATNPPISPIGK